MLRALNSLFYFKESHTIGSRSECIRNELLMFNFVQTIKSIGSAGFSVTCYLTNSGGKSSETRVHCRSMPHINCVMSPCASKGLIFMFRHGLHRENFPDFSSPVDFYNIPVLASYSNLRKKVSYSTQLLWWTNLCGVLVFFIYQASE